MKNIKVRNLISLFVITVMVSGIFALPVLSDDYKVYAASKVKVTFNAMGGKIDKAVKKAVNITKGKKIGKKLPAASKMIRSGYNFKGWYTKKSGGKKITKNTKIKKNATYYAQWKKMTEAEKLVGHWLLHYRLPAPYYDPLTWHIYHFNYYFNKDGTFQYFESGSTLDLRKYVGKYSVTGGKVRITNVKMYMTSSNEEREENINKYEGNYLKYKFSDGPYPRRDMTTEYKFGKDQDGDFLQITSYRGGDNDGVTDEFKLTSADKFRLKNIWAF